MSDRFNVTASGDIPDQRVDFCSTVSPSADDSSFQITIYGGWNLFEGNAFEDVYVLAIPSFRWIKINDTATNLEAKLPGKVGRKSMECQIYKDRQMLVLGGAVYIGNTQVSGETCNTSYSVIRVLDTTTFTWLDQFSSMPETYAVPQVVYNVIGGRLVYQPASTQSLI